MGKKKDPKFIRNTSPKSKGGRPIQLTKEIQDIICKCLSEGHYIEAAAAFAGVHKTTVYDWLKKGARKQGKIYEEFSNAVQLADGIGEHKIIDKILTNPNNLLWIAERKWTRRWGKKQSINLTEDENAGKQAFSEDQLMDLLESELDKADEDRFED